MASSTRQVTSTTGHHNAENNQADRVAALVAQRGISGDVASVFINDRAERNAIINLARRKRVLV
jgi:hypothetical protein